MYSDYSLKTEMSTEIRTKKKQLVRVYSACRAVVFFLSVLRPISKFLCISTIVGSPEEGVCDFVSQCEAFTCHLSEL